MSQICLEDLKMHKLNWGDAVQVIGVGARAEVKVTGISTSRSDFQAGKKVSTPGLVLPEILKIAKSK